MAASGVREPVQRPRAEQRFQPLAQRWVGLHAAGRDDQGALKTPLAHLVVEACGKCARPPVNRRWVGVGKAAEVSGSHVE